MMNVVPPAAIAENLTLATVLITGSEGMVGLEQVSYGVSKYSVRYIIKTLTGDLRYL
ncbi:MAG: hypothetical protein GY916_01715 [Gammaproteobacteria bacterium]|nr:hypothetical protein [Gammaproteobacteria bacterium]